MKFFINDSGLHHYNALIEKHGKEDLMFLGHHPHKEHKGIEQYYRMHFDGIIIPNPKQHFDSYQNMMALRYWHINRYEVNIEFEGAVPDKSIMCTMRPDKHYEDLSKRREDTYKMYLTRAESNYVSQSLYYTLLI